MPIADLNEAERAVAAALTHGREVDLRAGDPAADDPANAGAWGSGREVRADVLAALLLGEYDEPGAKPGLNLAGARITGRLHLAFAEIGFPVTFQGCAFDDSPDLYQARTRFLSFSGSLLPGLIASNIQVEGNLRLAGSRFTGEVRLPGGRISGNLVLNGATLSEPSGTAFNGEHLDLGGHLRAQDGFASDGTVNLVGARVGGSVELDRARLNTPGGTALDASNLIVQVGLFARNMKADGEVCVRFARVSGPLTLRRSRIRNRGGLALRATGLHAEAGLFLALVSADGQLRLRRSVIGGTLSLEGARLRHPGDVVVAADGITVDGSLLAWEGMRAEGEFSLLDATVTGPVHFEGATLVNPGGAALSANGLSVGKVLNLCDGFSARGRIRLTSAQVGSRLCLDGATLEAPGEVALKCWRLAAPELAMRTAEPVSGVVELRYARIGVLRDDPEVWPGAIRMDGLAYEVLDPMLPAGRRLGWLARDPDGYLPGAYEQLAATYRRLGGEADARETLLAGQRRRRAALPWYARFWGHLQDVTVGYGFRPMRAAGWLLALLAAGTVVFGLGAPPPLKPGEAPPFSSLVYTLDLLLPIIDFGQEKAYSPQGGGQWLAWGLIVAGWVLATTIAAGLTRSLRRA
ncbi:MAG: oxidoreductase [Nonomuraea sp.]|nr:oxidoreductase [Nonomuraea sp.]NUP64079.1 oxidoreductase [Nonomuraea sp.]NUP78691.1 oxidoreductase [Nonomuraea sp.]